MQLTLIVADEQLEHWGNSYAADPRGGSFEHFLREKLRQQRMAIRSADPARAPMSVSLLPAQRQIRSRYALSSKEELVVREALRRSVLVVENGHHLEKLRHHRWPRGRQRYVGQESCE